MQKGINQRNRCCNKHQHGTTRCAQTVSYVRMQSTVSTCNPHPRGRMFAQLPPSDLEVQHAAQGFAAEENGGGQAGNVLVVLAVNIGLDSVLALCLFCQHHGPLYHSNQDQG
jgi:hypothetical protein